MKFFSKIFELYLRPGCVLWIPVTVYLIDPCSCLDSGDSAYNTSTPATFKGLRSLNMKTVDKCCVPNCGVHDQILHKFPNPINEPDRFRDWLYRVGGDILGMENSYIYKYRRVCHLHFEEKYHTRSKMLSRIAVPTLRLSGFYSTLRQPLTDRSNQASFVPLTCEPVPSTSGICSTARCSSTDLPHHQSSSVPLTSAPVPLTSASVPVEIGMVMIMKMKFKSRQCRIVIKGGKINDVVTKYLCIIFIMTLDNKKIKMSQG